MEMGAGIIKSEFNQEFEIVENEDESLKLRKADTAIKYLQLLKDDLNELIKKNEHLQALNYLLYFLSNKSGISNCLYDRLDSQNQSKIAELLLNLMKILYINLTKKDYLSNEDVNMNFGLLFELLSKVASLTIESKNFCIHLNNLPNSIESLLYFLDDFKLISSRDEEEFEKYDPKNSIKKLNCSTLCIILLNLSKNCIKSNWLKCQAIESLTKFSEKIQFKTGFQRWYLFLTIENIRAAETEQYNSTFVFDIISDEPTSEKLIKKTIGIKYLKYLNESSLIADNEQAMNFLYFMSCLNDNDSFETIPDYLHDDFLDILKNLTKYLFDDIILHLELTESPDLAHDNKIQENKILKKNFYIFQNVTKIIQVFSNSSIKFCIKFNKAKDAIKVFIEFMANSHLSDYLVKNYNTKQSQSSVMLLTCYQYIVMCILNLSRVNYKFKKLWESLDSVNVLINFSQLIGPISSSLLFVLYIIISNIATDKQIDTLQEIRVAIKNITDLISQCADFLEGKEKINRVQIQVDETEEFIEVCTVCKDDSEWHLIELAEALYHLSVNDNIKLEIYHTFQMKDVLKRIIYNGNEIEKEYSLRCLYQLCFDDQIANDLAIDEKFISYMKQMAKRTDFKRKKLNQNSKGILFMISNKSNIQIDLFGSDEQPSNKESNKNQEVNSNVTDSTSNDKHIMISYNRDSREICLKIKNELEKLGYNVWIDVEDISGSSLESMADAIENSLCVLICMTEKYKLSSNCRLEAEYTIQLNKPIVPLILQANYKPDGWLGIILGSKMFINFKKYDWEECIRRLRAEILSLQKKSAKQEKKPNKMNKTPQQNSNNNINTNIIKSEEKQNSIDESKQQTVKENKLEWKEEDVDSWLTEKKFSRALIENIKPCNGKILYQLYLMCKTAPEFFYCTLRTDSNNKINLKDLAFFSYELNNLFNEENN